jgi:hypothetical protein
LDARVAKGVRAGTRRLDAPPCRGTRLRGSQSRCTATG